MPTVDAALTPTLNQLKEMLRTTLRLVQPIDLYVQANPELNAYCMPTRKGTRLVMCLHSSLVDLLTLHELMFVMGHEVGHAILGHGRIPKIGFDDMDFSPLEVVRTRTLSRRQEVSCDRVGLLACQDVRVAGSALLKIMSGLSDRWLTFDEEVFGRQFDQIADLAEVTQLEDAASTHPIIGMRAKLLRTFADSKLFADAMGRPSALVSEDDLERTSLHLLSVLEPDLSEIESASDEEAGNLLLVFGSLVLAAADGVFDAAEATFLQKRMKLTDDMVVAMQQPDFVERTLANIAEPRRSTGPQAKYMRAPVCCANCARSPFVSGGYDQAEQSVLSRIGQLLDLPEVVFSHVLTQTEVPEVDLTEKPSVTKPARRKKKPIPTE
ncbi:MAG: M48 family metallopeptidase [Sulfuritalea sp.]|nr:M48 family metallopeptidase [Sulfuritalea sp.]